ncbi:hypothetical protein [Niabella ginsengisoli]|uniref:Outer membrane protein beta-barrel domain-containing protein n=1 Tax=Niabella ginsengisoli TaxID=522298 RepID=A0ABS9SG35_9BACT|nr:hypothetical protein [Niabella ginsengisoli]MCH5597316.1 hypothetical protein [Niabella ginsengisoli]
MKINKLALICCLLICSQSLFAQLRAKEGRGYFNITNIAEPQYLQSLDSTNLTYASGYVKKFGYSLSTINGVFLNSYLSVGLGVGLQFTSYKASQTSFTPDSTFAEGYFSDNHNMTLLPIFADFRYYPNGTRNNLMFILDVGYAPLLKIANDFDRVNLNGGALVKLGAAYRVPLNETISFLPSLNLNAQRFGENTSLGANVGIGFMF